MVASLESSESRLVELKAKIESLGSARKQLSHLKARHIGTFHQIDTYFHVPKGRLKLREVEGRRGAELIYYERENVSGPKRSAVFIVRIPRPETFKEFFEKVLKKKVIVGKKREIYRYKGTQIHLDSVKDLGEFIEFERKTQGSAEAILKDREVLEELMEKFGIEEENLLKGSYSDLLLSREKHVF